MCFKQSSWIHRQTEKQVRALQEAIYEDNDFKKEYQDRVVKRFSMYNKIQDKNFSGEVEISESSIGFSLI